MARIPRGIRNNNPGNIRRSSDRWKGLHPQQTDPEFFVFEAPVWGIRAMAVILANYQRRHGLQTVAQIIGRWAPKSENHTGAYIAVVADRLGVTPRTALDLTDAEQLAGLIKAMIRVECGRQPYSDDLIRRAIALA
jgi:hypothetical protein